MLFLVESIFLRIGHITGFLVTRGGISDMATQNEWQPIETAPLTKNVLVYCKYKYANSNNYGYEIYIGHKYADSWWGNGVIEDHNTKIISWAPLLLPPLE